MACLFELAGERPLDSSLSTGVFCFCHARHCLDLNRGMTFAEASQYTDCVRVVGKQIFDLAQCGVRGSLRFRRSCVGCLLDNAAVVVSLSPRVRCEMDRVGSGTIALFTGDA